MRTLGLGRRAQQELLALNLRKQRGERQTDPLDGRAYNRGVSESSLLADRLYTVFAGEAWHGPALAQLLRDLDAASAAPHPWHGVHSAWEVVLHVTAWNKIVLRRMRGEAVELTHQQDWPPVSKFSDTQWQSDMLALTESHTALCDAVQSFPAIRLSETVPGKDYDFGFMLHGAADHIAYHSGQIALLKKQR